MDFDDILGIITLIIIYIVASGLSSKKKKQQKKKPAGEMSRMSAQDRKRAASAEQKAPSVPAVKREPMRTAMEGEDPCHEEIMSRAAIGSHYHEASPDELAAAGEGEDICHPGEKTDGRERLFTEYEDGAAQEDNQEMRRALLSGIVMSEILSRPVRKVYRNRS